MKKENPERYSAFFLTNNKARCSAKLKSTGRKVMLGSGVADTGLIFGGAK